MMNKSPVNNSNKANLSRLSFLHSRSAKASGLGDPVEMKRYVRFSRLRFYIMFVKPYPECERIFGGREAAASRGALEAVYTGEA
jgi:hypothetical protein